MLSANTADTSGQQMRYWWEIKSVPAGANPVFAHQGLDTSSVTGLTIPGVYTFTLRAFDDIHETTKDFSFEVNKSASIVADDVAEQKYFLFFSNPVLDEV